VTLVLSDGSSEPLDPAKVTESPDGALYTWVKADAKGGPFEAKFTRHAQTSLARFLREDSSVSCPSDQRERESLMLNHARFAPKPRDISPKK